MQQTDLRPACHINEQAGTITVTMDDDTGVTATISLRDMVNMFLYFQNREGVLRRLLFKTGEPMGQQELRKPLTLVNGFYIGQVAEALRLGSLDPYPLLRPVKVSEEDFERMLVHEMEMERLVRGIKEERKETYKVPMLTNSVAYDPIPEPLELEEWDAEERLAADIRTKLLQPEYWVNMAQNREQGTYAKLP